MKQTIINYELIHDCNGCLIIKGDPVLIDEPKEGDLYQHSFEGIVGGFRDGNVLVVDGDGDVFEVDRFQCTVQ